MGRVFSFFKSMFNVIYFMLQRPKLTLVVCLAIVGLSLVSKGTLKKITSFHQERKKIQTEVNVLQVQMAALDQQLTRAKDPSFLERKAMDQLDFANDDDLVFVFPDE